MTLATQADLTARNIVVADTDLAELYLHVASAAVRDAAGVRINQTTSTTTLYPNGGLYLPLPGGPVTAVEAVVQDGQTLAEGRDWTLWDGALYRPGGWTGCTGLPQAVTVTYTHGLPVVPADLVDLVCRMAATALGLAEGDGLAIADVASESLGDYAVTYRPDSGLTEMELSAAMRARLRRRFGGGAGMVAVR